MPLNTRRIFLKEKLVRIQAVMYSLLNLQIKDIKDLQVEQKVDKVAFVILFEMHFIVMQLYIYTFTFTAITINFHDEQRPMLTLITFLLYSRYSVLFT